MITVIVYIASFIPYTVLYSLPKPLPSALVIFLVRLVPFSFIFAATVAEIFVQMLHLYSSKK